MIIGAHSIVYSTDASADRAFFKDVLGLTHVDGGGGWPIFGLPPAELGVHPGEAPKHELYLLTDDVTAFVSEMNGRGIACTPPHDEGWGVLTELTLPSGGKLGVYEPRHPRPEAAGSGASGSKPKAKTTSGAKKKVPASSKKVAKKVGKTKTAKATAKPAPQVAAQKPGAKKPGAKKAAKKSKGKK